MGKDAGSAPAAPDPAKLIPIQSAADKNTFNYQTAANRFNTVSPTGTTTWNKQDVFDEDAYNKALQSWQGTNPQGTWVPGSPGTAASTSGGDSEFYNPGTPATAGYWTGAGSGENGSAPSRDQFTTQNWTQTTALSPEQQALYNAQTSGQTNQAQLIDALTKKLGGTLGSPLDLSSAPGLVGSISPSANIGDYESRLAGLDPTQYNKSAADAAYNNQFGYFDENQKQQQQQLEARLAEQGFVPGTPAYAQAMNQFQDNQNQSLQQLRNQATTQGFSVGNQQFGNQQSALQSAIAAAMQGFGQRQQAGQFSNAARNQSVAELLQQRQTPLNELNALRNGSQQSVAANLLGGTGATPSTGNLANTDVMGAYNNQYKALMDKYNANVASDNSTTSTLGSLAGLAGMLLFASDRRLKSDFELVGETPSGLPVYDYTIAGQRQTGVIAQDLLAVGQDDAVIQDGISGILMVDYSKVE